MHEKKLDKFVVKLVFGCVELCERILVILSFGMQVMHLVI